MTATMPSPAGAPLPGATSWAEVVRLRTLPAAVAPVILGAAGAGAVGSFSPVRCLLAAGVALALQIGCNLANDYSDGIRGTDDDRTGPPRLTASGQVAPGAVKAAALGCFAVGGLLGLVLVVLAAQWWLLVVGAAAIAAAWYYTGGSHPYGYAGLGEVFVFIFFGLVATAGTTYVQAAWVPGWMWTAACGVGAIACSLLMVNNLRDIRTDPAHGKRTLAVRLGEARARSAYTALVAVPVPLAALTVAWAAASDAGPPSMVRGGAVALMVAGALSVGAVVTVRPVRAGARGRDLIPALKAAGLYELAYAVVTGAALVLVRL